MLEFNSRRSYIDSSMIRKTDNSNSIFYISCADWECVLVSDDPDEAAAIAMERANKKYGKYLNLSPTIKVVNVNYAIDKMEILDDILVMYTPNVLANAGLHDLAKKYKKIINVIKNEE